jgi:hypothetical protein
MPGLQEYQPRQKISPSLFNPMKISRLSYADGEVDLSAFNYCKMDNLEIDSDDDTVQSAKGRSDISV